MPTKQKMRSPKPLTLKLRELAARITEHLRRFERDPKINVCHQWEHDGKVVKGRPPYYYAGASAAGSRVFVHYVPFQGHSSLTRAEAEAYLAWLDAGNVGRHYEQQRQQKERS